MPIPGGPPTNIATYRQVIRDISRPYLFMIRIPFLGTDYQTTAFARSSTLPSVKNSPVQVPFQSQNLNFGGPAEFDHTWTVNFLADEAHAVRKRFLEWQNLVYNPATLTHGHAFEYKADNVQIHQLGRTGQTVSLFNFVGLYVSNVGEITVDHASSTDPETFDVEFTYDYWVSDTNNFAGTEWVGGAANGNGVSINANVGGINLGVSL